MGVNTLCCCAPANPCLCTYPATLAVSAFSCDDGSSFVNWLTTPATTGPFTFTWGSPPAGMPTTIRNMVSNVFTGVNSETFSNPGWYTPGIPGTENGTASTFYLNLSVESCKAKIFLFSVTGSTWRVNLNVSPVIYTKATCTPFSFPYSSGTNAHGTVTGTHGGDDVTPDGNGDIGKVIPNL